MKSSFVVHGLIALCMAFASMWSEAQSRDVDEDASPQLRIASAFVWVPILVKNDKGKSSSPDVTSLRLSDNGAAEKVAQINTENLPISLVILMQTGGSASRFLQNYGNLPWLVDRLVGDSVREITLVTFDSRVEQIWHFPVHTDAVNYALTHQHAGDKGAVIKDAVAFGVRQLQGEPGRFRRIVLLLSQERDVGSSTSSRSLLEQLGSSSTVVYGLTFPGEKTRAGRARETGNTDSTEEELNGTGRALDDDTAKEVSTLTGGTDYQFDDQANFNSAMLETISDFNYGMTLGYQPSCHEFGFHRIDVRVDSPKLRVTASRVYWWMPPE